MPKFIGCAIVISALTFHSAALLALEWRAEQTKHCLSMSRIQRIEVVDESTLVFHMRGRQSYINHLPRPCRGLKNHSFIHETSQQNYCDLDVLTLVDINIGMRLGSCSLGKFQSYETLENRDDE